MTQYLLSVHSDGTSPYATEEQMQQAKAALRAAANVGVERARLALQNRRVARVASDALGILRADNRGVAGSAVTRQVSVGCR